MADTPHTPHATPAPGGSDGHGHGNDPVAQLWMAVSGASVGGHHEEVPGVDAKSAKVGHEPDKFDARTIVYVPVVVAVTLVVTYLLVQGAFLFVNGKESQQLTEATTASTDPAEIARVQKENLTKVKGRNELAGQLGTWDAKPVAKATPDAQTRPPVPQPPLEYNKQKNYVRKGANGVDLPPDPPFLRSFPDQGDHNSPVLYPEDLRPENYTDPWHDNAKLLAEPKWVVKDKLATVPIDEMIRLIAHDPKWKDTLKVAEKKAVLTTGTLGKPKMSAGGVTGPLPSAVEKKDDGHGHK